MRKLLFLLFFTVCAYGQVSVFNGDTLSFSNTDTLTGRWIRLENPRDVEGMSALYLAGDKLSGTQSKYLQVECQLSPGRIVSLGDTIVSQWQFCDSVATTYLDNTFGNEAAVTGYLINLADKVTAWQKFHMIRFRFYMVAGTHKTRLAGQFTTN